MRKKGIYENFFKRPLDFVISQITLILLLPLLLAISFLVMIKLGSPILFKQERPGLNEKIFKLYKFRTMTNKKDEKGILLHDSERLTKFGSFLRATSLDELPSLINIIKGDLSIVGPRPLLVEYLPLYNNKQKKRHLVRPGLTGLAQVSGRNGISWDDKFRLDLQYLNNVSFLQDVKIILMTIKKVILKEGINSSQSTTMEIFTGSKIENNEN
jgi:lipopolysaccharide/colanic/teichoic acid biosynthesis glycosyltransferase